MQMADEFGIKNYSPPAGGCLLTDAIFTKRLRDLFSHEEDRRIRDIELLKYGRHFRVNEDCKIIVGRNKADNTALKRLVREEDLVFFMADFPGPQVMVPYGDESVRNTAAELCVRYSDAPDDQEAKVICRKGDASTTINTRAASREDCERWII
jgi:predicted ribosome quality control (RQC) complex YloA/Tae2 family protein